MRKILLVISICVISILGMTMLTACGGNYYPDRVFQDLRSNENDRGVGADVRIMTANTLVHIENGYGGMPVAPRAHLFAEAVVHYAPDVIGLQEFSGDWYKELPKVEVNNGESLMTDYALLHEKSNKWTNIMYNTKTLTLIEDGLIQYDEETNAMCRLISWGLFEHKATGEKFAVTSTHLDFGKDKSDIVTSQVTQLAEFVQHLVVTYDVPVYQTGDYNMYRTDMNEGKESYYQAEKYELYLELTKSGNVKDSFTYTDKQTLGSYTDADGFTEKIEFDCEQWDYIFIKNTDESKSGPVKVEILHDFYFQSLSDHAIIYADIDFDADNRIVK